MRATWFSLAGLGAFVALLACHFLRRTHPRLVVALAAAASLGAGLALLAACIDRYQDGRVLLQFGRSHLTRAGNPFSFWISMACAGAGGAALCALAIKLSTLALARGPVVPVANAKTAARLPRQPDAVSVPVDASNDGAADARSAHLDTAVFWERAERYRACGDHAQYVSLMLDAMKSGSEELAQLAMPALCRAFPALVAASVKAAADALDALYRQRRTGRSTLAASCIRQVEPMLAAVDPQAARTIRECAAERESEWWM